MSNKKLVEQFIKSAKSIAKELSKDPSELTKVEFTNSTEMKEWDLRKLGGFGPLQKLYFPKEEIDPAFKSASAIIRSHRNKLSNTIGKAIFTQDEFNKSISDLIKTANFKLHPAIKVKKSNKKKKSRTIVAHVSDTHFGANIQKSEMGNVNQFNWTIAARRMALFAKQIVEYKSQYRDNTDLVILINGDIMAGVIHNQEFFVDLLSVQQVGTMHILLQFISYIAQFFDNITIECTEGNHDRSMHKGSKDRGNTTKWDNYLMPIYHALKEVLKAKHPNIVINIPTTPYAIFKAQGHHFFVTHGDTVINLGNPGKALNMSSISNQINKLNASELGGDNHFAAVICGHCHVNTLQLTDSGAFLLVNGCLSGSDPYAQSIGIFSNSASQQIFEITEDHAVGDFRMIRVTDADNQTGLDKIIEPFKGDLS
jgi:predicted phosphodiesterase